MRGNREHETRLGARRAGALLPNQAGVVAARLESAARDQLCRDFREAIETFPIWRPDHAISAYLDHSRKMFAFVHPSARVAASA